MKLTVLNPGGADQLQDFPDGPGEPRSQEHPPVNFHGFAACASGRFSDSLGNVLPEGPVLVLLRSDLRKSLEAVRLLKRQNRTVWISWKESGLAQVTQQLTKRAIADRFFEACAECDGALTVVPELQSVYRGAGARDVRYLPTPYPVDDKRWDFSVPTNERAGILIGTREREKPTRNLAPTLIAARSFKVPVSVISLGGYLAERDLRLWGGPLLRIIRGPLPYPDYLSTMAKHRLVFQMDRTTVPGQVAGDAALCGIPAVGGDGAVDRELFVALSDIERLILEEAYYRAICERVIAAARERISFTAIRLGLEEWFAQLSPKN